MTNFVEKYSITVLLEAASTLVEDYTRLAEIFPCELIRKVAIKRSLTMDADLFCPNSNSIRKDFERILQDGRLDTTEAPILYWIYRAHAGDDRVLSKEEAETSDIHLYLKNFGEILERIEPDRCLANAYGFLESETLSRLVDYKRFQFDLEPSRELRSQLLEEILQVETLITGLLSLAEQYKNQLLDEDRSYFNFVSAQNLWGVPNLFGCDPASKFELDGIRNFISNLSRIDSGLKVFKYRYEQGILSNSPDVRAFLESPFARLIDADCIFSGDVEASCTDYLIATHVKNAKVAVKFAADSGAVRFADELAKAFSKDLGEEDQQAIKSVLPDDPASFIETNFVGFANAVAGLDSAAVLAGAGIVGKALTGSVKFLTVAEKAKKGVGVFKYAFPGVQLLKTVPGQRAIAKVAIGAGNFAAEIGKAAFYVGAANYIGGKTTARWAGMAFNFFAGAINSYRAALYQNFSGRLASEDGNKIVATFLEGRGFATNGLDELASKGATYGNPRSFRPLWSASADESRLVLERLKEFRDGLLRKTRALERATVAGERTTQNILKLQGEIESLLPKLKDPQKIRRELEAIFAGSNDKVKGLSRLLEKTRLETKSQVKPATIAKQPLAVQQGGAKGGKKRLRTSSDGEPRVEPRSEKVARLSSETKVPAEYGELKKILKRPVKFRKDANDDLRKIYNEGPQFRKAILQRFKEIEDGVVKSGWQKSKSQTDSGSILYFERVGGKHRIFVREFKGGGGVEVENVVTRGSTGWSER